MKFRINVGGGELEFEGDTLQKIMEQAAFYLQLPTHCPVDGTVAVFHFNQADSYKYYSLISTGETVFEYKLGIRTDNNTLYPKYWPHDAWVMYDTQRDAQVCVWLNGNLLAEPYPVIEKPKGKPVRLNGKEIQPPTRRVGMGGDDEVLGGDETATQPTPENTKPSSSDDMSRYFNQLGRELYGVSQWPAVREKNIKRLLGENSNQQPTKAQIQTLINGMKKLQEQRKAVV